jgi:hypothetical protein
VETADQRHFCKRSGDDHMQRCMNKFATCRASLLGASATGLPTDSPTFCG